MVSVKYGLLFISGLDTDIVKTLANIQFGEVLSSLELGYKFRDQEK